MTNNIMAIQLNCPEAPATKKQLWLLHILTKTDTRKLCLTMQQASDKITAFKNGNTSNHRKVVRTKPDNRIDVIAKLDKRYHNLTGQGLDLGNLKMIQAFKEIALHHDPKTKQAKICVSVKASAIFPGGKKPHIISEFIKDSDTVTISPLFAHLRRNVKVSRIVYHQWIKGLPVVFNKYSTVPESWHDKALELAQAVDSYIAILDITAS